MLPMQNSSFYCFPIKKKINKKIKKLGGGTEEVEQLEDERATVVITLHSFQAAAAFKGCFGYQKRLESGKHYQGMIYKIFHLHQKILLSNRTDELRMAKTKTAVRNCISKDLCNNFRLYLHSIFYCYFLRMDETLN